MTYILDAYKYLPEFLHNNEVMCDFIDCLNALISSEQPYFEEIKGAYQDMMYNTRDYSKLTYDAKINILKGLGFDYLLGIIELDDAKVESLLMFCELLYALKGKKEGLELCLNLMLTPKFVKEGIRFNSSESSLLLSKDYLNDVLNGYNDGMLTDFLITFDYNNTTASGSNISRNGLDIHIYEEELPREECTCIAYLEPRGNTQSDDIIIQYIVTYDDEETDYGFVMTNNVLTYDNNETTIIIPSYTEQGIEYVARKNPKKAITQYAQQQLGKIISSIEIEENEDEEENDISQYIIHIRKDDGEATNLDLFSFDLKISLLDDGESYRYKILNINYLSPTSWTLGQLPQYEYFAWDETSPKGTRFTATLQLRSLDYSDGILSRMINFLRCYMLPLIDVNFEQTVEGDYLFLYPCLSLNLGERKKLMTPKYAWEDDYEEYEKWLNTIPSDTATIANLALYDHYGSNDVYDGETAYYASNVFTEAGQLSRVRAIGTYIPGVIYYSSATEDNIVDTTDFIEGVTDVSPYWIYQKYDKVTLQIRVLDEVTDNDSNIDYYDITQSIYTISGKTEPDWIQANPTIEDGNLLWKKLTEEPEEGTKILDWHALLEYKKDDIIKIEIIEGDNTVTEWYKCIQTDLGEKKTKVRVQVDGVDIPSGIIEVQRYALISYVVEYAGTIVSRKIVCNQDRVINLDLTLRCLYPKTTDVIEIKE